LLVVGWEREEERREWPDLLCPKHGPFSLSLTPFRNEELKEMLLRRRKPMHSKIVRDQKFQTKI